MGICQTRDLLRHSEIKIENGNQVIEDLVNSCEAYQVTNAISNPKNPGTWLQGKKPGAYWEVNLMEIKPGKFDYRYLLVFTDNLSGWTKIETAQTVANKLLEVILPRYGFPTDNILAFVSQVNQSLATILGID